MRVRVKDWEEWKKSHHIKLKEDMERLQKEREQNREAKTRKNNTDKNYTYKI